ALLNIDGTRNQVFVFGGVTFGYSSNIFSEATGRGDYNLDANAGVELRRRAGIIAVNATFQVDYQRFSKYTEENSLNPRLQVEFRKSTGRTTGALTLKAFREGRSDSAVDVRTNSWNFPLGLSLKYPVNDKYYFTSTTDYLRRRYNDNSALADLTDCSEGLDLFYVYTSKLDLVGGYRVRVTTTSSGDDSTDHWFNLGATGGLFAKLNGTVRLGYQLRHATGATAENFTHLNALAGLSWPVTRKLTLSGQLSRDFNTIATGASIDSTIATLNATYAYNRRLELESGVTWGRNDFLGHDQLARVDDFFTWDVTARYKFNEHLNVGATYSYFRNWSTFSFSDFDRQSITFDIASRY
ncbi:MAG: outer membrane beta-barrel protein, partial [Opitutae bacterium]|nr:outer membrane beta-barrel protein [Opitutae bacterium]